MIKEQRASLMGVHLYSSAFWVRQTSKGMYLSENKLIWPLECGVVFLLFAFQRWSCDKQNDVYTNLYSQSQIIYECIFFSGKKY